MSTVTSTTILFNQLRTYCYNIEADSKKLRRNVEKSYTNNNNKNDFGEAEVHCFIDSLSKDTQVLHTKIDSVEEKLLGPRGDISHVSTGELLDKSAILFQANKSMMETLSIYVAKFSAAQTSSKSKVVCINNDENSENNSDNLRNKSSADSSNPDHGRAVLGDITRIACGEEHSDSVCDDRMLDNTADKSAVIGLHVEEFSSPHNMSSMSDSSQNLLIRTPNLEEWKLSESTRTFVVKNAHLAPENRRRSMLGGSELIVSTTPLNSSTYSSRKTILSSSRPSTVEKMKLQTPQQLLKSCHLLAVDGNAIDTNYSSPTAIDTPETPTIGTPFQTCDLRTRGATSVSKLSMNSDISSSFDCKATFRSASDAVGDINDDFIADEAVLFTDAPSSVAMPLKRSHLISPVHAAIPSILQSDWDKAPSFLKLQVTIEDLNMSLMLLNRHIEKAKIEGDVSVDMFTQDEMESILCGEDDCIQASSLKAIILGLVTLKRLDLGNENKVKVFRIKKSY